MDIRIKIKEARVESGYTQEQAAEKLFISRQTISNWENGKTLPDIVSVINMSDLYQIDLENLLKGDNKMREKIEKDTNAFEQNKKLILTTIIIIGIVGIVRLSSIFIGGYFNAFCESASSWILMGIGIAFCCANISAKG